MSKQALKMYEDLIGIEEKINTEQHEANLKILCWNIKSIRRPLVRRLLIEKMLEEEIDIACIQETYLSNTDQLWIKGYRIFRANNTSRLRGVAILIRKTLQI